MPRSNSDNVRASTLRPSTKRGPNWRAIAKALADRLQYSDYCSEHPYPNFDLECPFCSDQHANLQYENALKAPSPANWRELAELLADRMIYRARWGEHPPDEIKYDPENCPTCDDVRAYRKYQRAAGIDIRVDPFLPPNIKSVHLFEIPESSTLDFRFRKSYHADYFASQLP